MYKIGLLKFLFLSIFFSGICFQSAEAGNPSLIPLPQSVKWNHGTFLLNNCKSISINDASLKKEALSLQQYILEKTGRHQNIVEKGQKGPCIMLKLGKIISVSGKEEAYELIVNTNSVTLTANTSHGIFNGLQTLYQLIQPDFAVPACKITDYPAYSWRGYMVDVGRNYQTPALLKKQIDVMSRYKMNVFHFHLTEDIAWRLQIKQYPQLTAPENMLRNKGKFYSVEDVKELINYCKERYITLVPEIDMPGHSAAFTTAMGVDMQSPKGFEAVKNILKEVCTTYDIPYLHIGADEVIIENKQFLPEVTKLIEGYHKKVIAWAPGGNYDDLTIRQLWKDEGEQDLRKRTIRYIDSRSLYISDMDPLNTVVTIFERQLGGKSAGDSSLLGAEVCMWNDRVVVNEDDLIKMNAIYPSLLAFGERSWRGGGYELAFNIGADSSLRAKAFTEFEKRLLVHKSAYFSSEPFIYVKQTDIKWKLLGPFKNDGNLEKSFWPEEQSPNPADSIAIIRAIGGTIWLWHTNWPSVKAWITDPEMNTTWYAYTNFYSKTDTLLNFWIDFKDQSRSGADATPPRGEWDYKKSKLWLNGNIISPPQWTFAGRSKGRLNEPLVDEAFYYRPPSLIQVKKGWNKVLVKLPMNDFILKDWQVPPKWMFTFIPVQKKAGINWDTYPTVFKTDHLEK